MVIVKVSISPISLILIVAIIKEEHLDETKDDSQHCRDYN